MIRFTMSGLWPLTFSSRYMQLHAPQDPGKISSLSRAAALSCLLLISWFLMISQLSFELMKMMLLLMIHVLCTFLVANERLLRYFQCSRTAGSDGSAPRLVQVDGEDRRGPHKAKARDHTRNTAEIDTELENMRSLMFPDPIGKKWRWDGSDTPVIHHQQRIKRLIISGLQI